MTKTRLAAILVWTALCVTTASAATTTGRITYIYPGKEQMILDSSQIYSIKPGINLSSIAVADRVTINWNKKNGEDIITAIAKAPLSSGTSG